MEVVSSMRLSPTFDYMPTVGCKPSHRRPPAESLCQSDEVREIVRLERNKWSHKRSHDHSTRRNSRQGHRMLRKSSPMTGEPKPHNAQKEDPTPLVKTVTWHARDLERKKVTITDGYEDDINRAARKAQMRGMQQVLMAEQGNRIMVPTITFDGHEGQHCSSLHNDSLVVKLKVANALVHRDRYRELY
ncbi:hypothetical protein Cgig2_028271 [Carnegiea gigantea]|uniref:Uncharacterized protein n=1 Tax=Carnegiea gigantea TaxID=171969 RepID=A0A9Q1GNQ2_9CARY|nr:hypothetical protein Cgig2_028271 [Carnegiea gigantea]